MTDSRQCFKPIPTLIGELNRHLGGWAEYFSFGYPSSVYCEIEHLQRRSQRPCILPQGQSWLRHLARLGLGSLSELVHA